MLNFVIRMKTGKLCLINSSIGNTSYCVDMVKLSENCNTIYVKPVPVSRMLLNKTSNCTKHESGMFLDCYSDFHCIV